MEGRRRRSTVICNLLQRRGLKRALWCPRGGVLKFSLCAVTVKAPAMRRCGDGEHG